MAHRSMPAAFLGLSLLSPATGMLAIAPGVALAIGLSHEMAFAEPLGRPQADVTRLPPHLRAALEEGIGLKWSVKPSSPYVGQTIVVALELHMKADWASESLVQLFQQELTLPVQVEAFSLASKGLIWLDPEEADSNLTSGNEPRTTLVVDGAVTSATRDSVQPLRFDDLDLGRMRTVAIECRGRPLRAGPASLAAPVARFTQAMSFRDDFVRGRTPVRPKREEARGQSLSIEVRKLPEHGRPLGFDGAVGSFKLEATGPARAVEVDTPFDLRVQVMGPSILPDGVQPRLAGMDGFTKLAVERTDEGTWSTFRVSLAGRRTDIQASPTLEFDVFDPDTAQYALVTSGAVPLAFKARSRSPIGPTVDANSEDPASEGSGPAPADRGGEVDSTGSPDLLWTVSMLALVGTLAFVSALRRIAQRQRLRAEARARPHVLMIGKYPLEAAAGDVVSVRRLGDHLRSKGFLVSYSPVTDDGGFGAPPTSIPTVIHALNAELPATLGAKFAKEWDVPLVVTTTGTDLNRGLMELSRRATVLANLKAADRVLTLTDAQVIAVQQAVPGARVERITQGILLDRSEFNLREAAGVTPGRPIALMLGGLRSVKGQRMAIQAWAKDIGWHLVIAGDPVDPEYADEIRRAGQRVEHMTILEPLPHRDAISALAEADALLNTSDSEGESRALLEAMTLGTPVVARRNPGNAGLIENGATGLLFDGADEIEACLAKIIPGAPFTNALVAAAKGFVERRHGLERDEDALARIYHELMGEYAAETAPATSPSQQPVPVRD